ncbi:hypothetical protein BN946_scf184873.g35 [Trametes cinnabarina]|uniref:CxC1-like cysteine cluster associated with KDZ transposases domain-containing protein n=1 Tax=Pycnoporus cinnabarinus TaxID=5643 RepID=A0A060SP56_PYCCI|nr:hypothetical protein BN946_scf184873.g35 [Trametes cinnabarina]
MKNELHDCLDVYLAVLRKIDKRVQQALNRDTADWRVKNACPACCYELDGEPHLTFARIIALDGNNSLKRVAKFGDREVADTREFGESDYYLPAAFVDIYKDEVKRTGEVAPPAVPMDDHSYHLDHDDRSDTDTDTNADDAASDDGDPKFRECTQNWKAAGKDEDKKMWGIFDESGIFASACRHGFILWISDMIKSGELSKHPLSHVGKSLKVLGPRLLFGYDIGYASKYHRRLFIDLFFKQWDEDKYANLVTMLLNNYRQALGIMKEESAAVNEALRTLQCTHEDLARWQAEEAAYFARVGTEDPANAAAVEYVTLLRELRTVENQVATTMSSFMTSIPEDYSISSPRIAKTSNPTYYSDASRTRKKETERRLLREKRDNTLRDVIALEIKMGIDTRWRPDMTEYQTTLKYIAERDYQVALEKLHGLVVQRLFELHNLNISQTAYKVRTYIAKNLQRRSKAIRTAVKQYNAAAQALTPPHPPLDWTKVTHYTFLDEFELLRDTKNDIRAKPWAQPLVRETMKKARRVIRAQEEVVRCNVEIRRLHTSILDENRMLDDAVSDAHTRADPVLGPLELFATRCKRVNMRLLAVVAQIHDLEGFSGEKTPGRRLGPVPQDSASAPADEQEIERERAELQVDDQADFVKDADLEDMEKLVNFAMNIT